MRSCFGYFGSDRDGLNRLGRPTLSRPQFAYVLTSLAMRSSAVVCTPHPAAMSKPEPLCLHFVGKVFPFCDVIGRASAAADARPPKIRRDCLKRKRSAPPAVDSCERIDLLVCDHPSPPHPPGPAVAQTMTSYPPDYDERLLDNAPKATRAEKQVCHSFSFPTFSAPPSCVSSIDLLLGGLSLGRI